MQPRPLSILYISHYYPPEMGAPAARVSELARYWTAAGCRVTVLTGYPNQPSGLVPPPYRSKLWRLTMRERLNGVDVVRTAVVPAANSKASQRMLNYGSFLASAALRGTFLRSYDVVIATSPQLLVGLAGLWIAGVKRRPLVFEVRDLWPESLLASGVGREGSRFIRTLDAIARRLYRSAKLIVASTPAQREDLIKGRGVPAAKIAVVENGVETDLFRPLDQQECRRALGIEPEAFVVAYIGTIGIAMGLRTALEAAARLEKELPKGLVLIVGAGSDAEVLKQEAAARGLHNVRFTGEVPRAKVPEYIGASDVCLVTLRKSDVFRSVIPSKMLEYMAGGRPIILAVEGQARSVLDKAGAGLAVPPDDAPALAGAITALARDADGRKRLGAAGPLFINKHYRREAQAERYLGLLRTVAGKGS